MERTIQFTPEAKARIAARFEGTTSKYPQVLSVKYDARTNKTHVRVQTLEFTDWFWVSGRFASEKTLLSMLAPVIERKLAEFALSMETKQQIISASSAARIERFFEEFIRSREVEALTSERDSDYFNEPERAARCAAAAEYGGDGKTHAEVIGDWRDAFKYMIWHRKGFKTLDRFETAVYARINAVEE